MYLQKYPLVNGLFQTGKINEKAKSVLASVVKSVAPLYGRRRKLPKAGGQLSLNGEKLNL